MRKCDTCGSCSTTCYRDSEFPCWDQCTGCGARDRAVCRQGCVSATTQENSPVQAPQTGLVVSCDKCHKPLQEPGALAFGIPNDGVVAKLHLCVNCWPIIHYTITGKPLTTYTRDQAAAYVLESLKTRGPVRRSILDEVLGSHITERSVRIGIQTLMDSGRVRMNKHLDVEYVS